MYFNSAPLYIGTRNNYLSKKIISKAKKKIYLRCIFFYVRGISSLVSQSFGKKRGENPVYMSSLLFANTNIVYFLTKSKSL